MAVIMLFYFYCAGCQANEGHGIFCWCLLIGDSVQNTIRLFSFSNSNWTGFRKIIVQDEKVVAILSVISKI